MDIKTKKVPVEIFSYYRSYFHDGDIENIECFDDEVVFEMQSTPIYTCDNRDGLPLSGNNTIYGRLHAKSIVSIQENEQQVDSLKMEYDYVDIIRFEIVGDRISFIGMWHKDGGKVPYEKEMFVCHVIAREIYWENTANITDPVLWGKFLGLEGPPPYNYPPWYCEKYGIEPSGEPKRNV